MKKIILPLFLLFLSLPMISQTLMPIPAHGSNYASSARGFWFTAPCDFVITGLRVPSQSGTGLQYIHLMKLGVPAPAYPATTTPNPTLIFINGATNGVIQQVNIPVSTGDHIGVLGTAGTSNSYATPSGPFTSSINGIPVTITRFLFQGNLTTGPATAVSQEATGPISRVEIYWELPVTSPNDAGVTDILSPISDCDGSIQDVEVEVSNLGINQINGVQIHWTVNSVIQPTFQYNGFLDTINGVAPSTANVVIGNLTLSGGNSYDIVAWTELPNNAVDTVNGNDSSYVTIQGYNFPTVNLGLDTITCPNDPITLNAGSGRDSILWNTNATTQTIVANTAQTYSVDVWKNGCIGNDAIVVNFFPAPPTVNLGNDTMICYGDSIMLDATAPGVTYLWQDNSTGPTYYADTVGNYSVTIEDGNTCKNSDDINVSLFSNPLISLSVVPRNSICFGSPFEFRANSFTQGATMYQWKINTVNSGAPTSNNKFSPSLMYGDSVNVDLLTDVCSSTTYAIPSNYVTMYLKPEPKLISGKAENDTVIENSSKNYLVPVVQGSTFTWSAVGGSIASPIGNAVAVQWGSAMDTAKILVEEKDAGNCRYTNVRNVVIISIVGVKDENNLIGIGYAYPNPANTSVTIPLVIDGTWDIDLSLYDMTGKKVKVIYAGEVSGNRDVTFGVDDLDNGMYFYKITTSDGYETVKKLSIKH